MNNKITKEIKLTGWKAAITLLAAFIVLCWGGYEYSELVKEVNNFPVFSQWTMKEVFKAILALLPVVIIVKRI